mmetsp:Transcript_33754/g.78997  ORF Transcript_33754/g.78997 Transcript_33754/m.78997 type:complete len:235 (-) Transcript_33754:169-873(-)
MVTQLAATPLDSTRVRAVLHQAQPVTLADVRHAVHVGYFPAHVRQQQHGGAAGSSLALEVVEIHRPLVRRLDQHGLGVEAHDRGGERGEGEAVGEHAVPCSDADDHQGQHDGGGTRVDAERVLLVDHLRKLALSECHLRVDRAVPEEAARAHHLHRGLDARRRHGHRLGEVLGEWWRRLQRRAGGWGAQFKPAVGGTGGARARRNLLAWRRRQYARLGLVLSRIRLGWRRLLQR